MNCWGAYSKAEDEAMNTTFGAHGKRRLNIVFDVIGFAYPDYCFPARKQGTKRKITTTTSSVAPKLKRTKVLTHWAKSHSLERAVALPATEKIEVVEFAEATPYALEIIPVEAAEAATAPLEKSEPESSRTEQQSKLQSPTIMTGLSKITTTRAATPRKGRRMASVLDAILKPSKVSTLASTKVSNDRNEELGEAAAASASPACAEVEPSKTKPVEHVKESLPEKLTI
jgi:hypothetical protein